MSQILKLIPLLAVLGSASTGCVSQATTERERILVGHTVDVKSVAFSPDGKTLASAGFSHETDSKWAGEIKLWDIASGTERTTFKGQKGAVFVAFSSDGKNWFQGAITQTLMVMTQALSVKFGFGIWPQERRERFSKSG